MKIAIGCDHSALELKNELEQEKIYIDITIKMRLIFIENIKN